MLTRNRLYGLIAVLAAGSYSLLFYTWFAGGHGFAAEVCPIHRITGIPCPSCGTIRAVLLMVEGDVPASLLMNPLGVLAVFLLAVLPAWVAVDLIRKKDHLFRFYKRTEKIIAGNKRLASLLVLLILANWAWNVCKGV